jgi:hypothetical protein
MCPIFIFKYAKRQQRYLEYIMVQSFCKAMQHSISLCQTAVFCTMMAYNLWVFTDALDKYTTYIFTFSWRQQVSAPHWHLSVRLHDVIKKKITIKIFTIRSEVPMMVTIKTIVFYYVIPYSLRGKGKGP